MTGGTRPEDMRPHDAEDEHVPLRVALLVGAGPSSWAVVNAVAAAHEVVCLLVEPRESRQALVRRRLRRLGVATVAGQLAFQAVAVPVMARASRRRVRDIQQRSGLVATPPALPAVLVSSANSDEARAALRASKPDVVVINGTRILDGTTIAAAGAPVVNVHAGITPSYRGVHGGYWALLEQEPERCGVTVHLVDTGIDTGAVLAQALITATDDDSFVTYPWLQLAAGIPLLLDVLQQLRAGLVPHVTTAASEHRPLRYHPTLWTYLYGRWLLGVK